MIIVDYYFPMYMPQFRIKSSVIFLIVSAALLLTFSSCRKKRGSPETVLPFDPTPVQNVWVGYFNFDEYGGGDIGESNPTPIFVGHILTVRALGDSLRGNLTATGFQHSSDIDCSVRESADTLNVYFLHYGDNHDTSDGSYTKGELLLSLVRQNYAIFTKWKAYKPVFFKLSPRHNEQSLVSFMKENDDDVPDIDIAPFDVYWSAVTQTLRLQDSVKLAYMTSFPLVGSNYVRPEGALTDLVSRTDFVNNYQVVMFPALRKVLQLKKASDFRQTVKTPNDNIFLPNGVVPVGAQVYRLAISSKELQQFQQVIAPDEAKLLKEQAEVLKRNNKLAKDLENDYGWAVYVARLRGKYRICYVGVEPNRNPS
jgi:hypothetical protein